MTAFIRLRVMLSFLQRARREILHRIAVHIYCIVMHWALLVGMHPQILLVAYLAIVLVVNYPQVLRLEVREARRVKLVEDFTFVFAAFAGCALTSSIILLIKFVRLVEFLDFWITNRILRWRRHQFQPLPVLGHLLLLGEAKLLDLLTSARLLMLAFLQQIRLLLDFVFIFLFVIVVLAKFASFIFWGHVFDIRRFLAKFIMISVELLRE